MGNDMHTKDLARALRAFAEIADFDRSQELHRLAAFFDGALFGAGYSANQNRDRRVR
jgi:hypothetical protein